MKRTALVLAAVLGLTLLAAPAQADDRPNVGTGPVVLTSAPPVSLPVPPARPTATATPIPHPVVENYIPLCVTTIWRARHTGQPKTPRGHYCLMTRDMFVPNDYIFIWYARRHGHLFRLYARDCDFTHVCGRPA